MKRLVLILAVFFLTGTANRARAVGPSCQVFGADIPPLTQFYGGTFWAVDDARWEAIRNGTWTFDTGVGSSINTGSLFWKPTGYHKTMEGWLGITNTVFVPPVLTYLPDYSNITRITDLPPPFNSCNCAMQDSVLLFTNDFYGHDMDAVSAALSPWIDLNALDVGKPGRVVAFDAYGELPQQNYLFYQIFARWRIGAAQSALINTGPIKHLANGECTTVGHPIVYDLSSLIPLAAEEVQIGFGVSNLCSLNVDCTGATNSTPYFDNVRFGVYPGPVVDSDNDGVSDAVENLAAGADGNGDGTVDRSQRRIVSIDDPIGGTGITTFSLSAGTAATAGGPVFRCVKRLAPAALPVAPATWQILGSAFDYAIAGASSTPSTLTLTIKFPPDCPATNWFVFGPEPGNATPHWYDFSWNGTNGSQINGQTMTVTFRDNQRGDADFLTGGLILGPGAPMVRQRPIITSVKDIGNDQGGQVRLNFLKTSYDVGISPIPIQSYEVYRKIDPNFAPSLVTLGEPRGQRTSPKGTAIAGWDYVLNVPAHGDSTYNVVVPTLGDSTTSGIHRSSFFVRAATVWPSIYFDSFPDSGWSVDNLAPQALAQFSGSYYGNATHLAWAAGEDPDLDEYRVYRGTTAGFAPDPSSLIAEVSETQYADPGPAGRYYKLAAVDVHGNQGAVSVLTPGQTSAVPDRPAELVLAGVQPNPSTGGPLRVRFALPSELPARLDLIDVVGRRQMTRDLTSLGPGYHEIDLDAGNRLVSGIYFVRLVQGRDVRSVRVVVVN